MPSLTCVILAAGRSSRMGFEKLTAPLRGGETLLDRATNACAGYPTVLVSSAHVARHLTPAQRVRVVVNDRPELGMTHSLRLADAVIDPAHRIAVVPADMPLIDAALLELLARASPHADVCYPAGTHGRRGHPVIFSPRARRSLAELEDGDTLRVLRDDTRLTQHTLFVNDRRPFYDVDDPQTFESLS